MTIWFVGIGAWEMMAGGVTRVKVALELRMVPVLLLTSTL